jgi:hypothetical protein
MSRAAILPTPGDPFLLAHWMRYFNEIWGDEVDKLYVHLDSPAPEKVIEYIKGLLDNPKVILKHTPEYRQHGDAINEILDQVEEEYIMLIEDDAFIFKKGVVDHYFKALEANSFDVIGSKRCSCSQSILRKAEERWGLDWRGVGDSGCNFWPNFFFIRKENLLKTDRDFNAKGWKRGDYIKPLDWIVDVDVVASDTFVSTSLQLHEMGLRMWYIPQYHGSPDDIQNYDDKVFLFDGKAPWVHIGSLSSGFNGVLMDEHGRSLANIELLEPSPSTVLPKLCNTPGERREWERRVQWWERFWEDTSQAGLEWFHEQYGKAIERVKVQYKLNRKNILKRKRIYKELGCL